MQAQFAEDGVRLLTTSTAAEITSLSEKTIRRAIDSGELPHVRFGRAVRIPLVAVQAWIDQRTVAARELG